MNNLATSLLLIMRCCRVLPVLQSLVIGSSMVVVAFITLLQNPLLGSPSWLPLLAAGWAGSFIVTMVLQSTLPLPNIQRWVLQGRQIASHDAMHRQVHVQHGVPMLAYRHM
jgi:hypothetical protein